jgi:hypothetical protein
MAGERDMMLGFQPAKVASSKFRPRSSLQHVAAPAQKVVARFTSEPLR